MRVILAAALLLSACGNDPTPTAPRTDQAPIEEVALSAPDLGRVCRAAIATLNGHPPTIIKVTSASEDLARVEYARPSDGKVWLHECRHDDDRVIWRTVDADGPGSGEGRWRNSRDDERMIFKISGDRVTITTTYSDGSGGTETFEIPPET